MRAIAETLHQYDGDSNSSFKWASVLRDSSGRLLNATIKQYIDEPLLDSFEAPYHFVFVMNTDSDNEHVFIVSTGPDQEFRGAADDDIWLCLSCPVNTAKVQLGSAHADGRISLSSRWLIISMAGYVLIGAFVWCARGTMAGLARGLAAIVVGIALAMGGNALDGDRWLLQNRDIEAGWLIWLLGFALICLGVYESTIGVVHRWKGNAGERHI